MTNATTNLRFGPFTIDGRAGCLRRGGDDVHITPKALLVLEHLARAAGALVTREALFATCWPGQSVTDDALTRCIREVRAVLHDDSRKPQYLLTVHRRGYRFIAAVHTDRDNAATPHAHEPAEGEAEAEAEVGIAQGAGFVGRGDVIARAQPLVEDCMQRRRGAVIVISGEPGIGKSRLAQHLCAEARSRGMRVLTARASEERGAPPFWLWIQVLRALSESSTAGASVNEIMALIADAATGGPRPTDTPRFSPESTRFRIRDAVTRCACAAADAQPLVLLMEDLHAAEADCLQVLASVALAIRDAPVLIIATYRDVGAPANPACDQMLAELTRITASRERFALRGLNIQDVTQLLAMHTSAGIALRLREMALQKTGGNPLYLNELLALPVDRPLDADAAYELWALDKPESVRQLLARRIQLLSEPCRVLLSAAAVAGSAFSSRLLAQCRLASPATIAAALEEARTQRLLVRTATQPKDWRFSHGLVRETLYDALPPLERASLHLTVARALEQVATGQNDQPEAELARHYVRATPGPLQAQKVIEYLGLAARRSFDAYAFGEAAEHFAELCERLQLAEPQDDVALGTASLGAALAHGYCGKPDAARAYAGAALHCARRAQDALLIRNAVVVRCTLEPAYPPRPELVALIDDALAALGDKGVGDEQPGARAELLAQRGFQHYILGNISEQQADAHEALALARRANDQGALEQALKICSYAFANPWQEQQWQAAYEERIALARRKRDHFAEYDARRHRLEHLMQIGPPDELDAEFARLKSVIERLDTPSTRATLLRVQAGFAICRGDTAAAWQSAQQAYTEGHASTDPGTADAFAILQMGALLGFRGEHTQVATQVSNGDVVAHNSLLIAARVYVLCITGQWSAARTQLQLLAERDFVDVPRDMTYGLALSNLAISCMLLRDKQAARAMREHLQPYAGRNVTALCYYSGGCASLHLSLLEATLGDWDAAHACCATAVAMSRRMGHTAWLAGALNVYADICERQGNHIRAGELAAEARALSDAMDIPLTAFPSLQAAM